MATRLVKIKDLVKPKPIEQRICNWYHDSLRWLWSRIRRLAERVSSSSWRREIRHSVCHVDTIEDREKRLKALIDLENLFKKDTEKIQGEEGKTEK